MTTLPPEVLSANVSVPQQQSIIGPASRLLAGVQDMVIDSDPVYEAAADDLANAKSMRKAIDADRKELTRPLDELKAKIMDKYRPAIEVCDQVISIIEPKMLTYRREQEAKAEAERKRQEEIARQERARLEQQAAEARRQAEERAAAEREAARIEAEQLAAAGKQEEAQQARDAAERAALETLANAEAEAAAIQEVASVVSAAPVQAPAKVSGTSIAGTYKGRVKDKLAFVQFVAANPMYLDLLDANETGLNAQARSLKQNLKMPGIEVYLDQSIRSRSR
jgi:hypothetical protein